MFYQKFNRHGKKRMFNRLLAIVIICFPNCKALKIKQVISNFDIGDDFFSFLVQFLSFYVKVLLSRLDFWEAFNYVECLRSLVLIVDRYFISGTLRENLQRFRSFSSSSLAQHPSVLKQGVIILHDRLPPPVLVLLCEV